MCGITGYVNFSSSSKHGSLFSMTGEIEHRGPDSYGRFFSKNRECALGIRRLSIIDLKTGDQPIKNEDGSVTVVYNGEIYNYQKLKKLLVEKGHKFRTKADTEVLVHMYEQFGDGFVNQINGMFAFSIWDEKKKKLILARDRVGIKPLYYYHAGKKLVFGSEIKTILAYLGTKPSVDIEAIKLYTYLGYIPGDRSIYKNIKKLPPGSLLTFTKAKLLVKTYFELSANNYDESELENLFESSVASQLVSDVPVGVFLSGGIDSSLISYYAAARNKNLKSFSIYFENKSYDESEFAKYVSKKLGTEHISETFGYKDVMDNFDSIVSRLDEPFADPSLFPTYKVSKLASKYVKVVLSGDGGDELFGGYPTYQAHIMAERFRFVPKWMVDFVSPIIDMLPLTLNNYDKKTVMKVLLQGFRKPLTERHVYWMRTFFLGNNTMMKKPNLEWEKDFNIGQFERPSQKARVLDFHTYLKDNLLFKVDRASMLNSLEVRVPFLDNKLIDFAFSTNLTHVTPTKNKILLRSLLKDKLPEVAKRSKKGFGMPVATWLTDELKDFSHDVLKNNRLYEFIPKKDIDKVWENHQKGKENNYGTLWMLVMLSGWLDNWT